MPEAQDGVGDRFTMLNRGRSQGTFEKGEISREEVLSMMAGGRELEQLTAELDKSHRGGQIKQRRAQA